MLPSSQGMWAFIHSIFLTKICFSFALGTLVTGTGLSLRTFSPEMAQPYPSRQALLLKPPEETGNYIGGLCPASP